MLSTLLFKSSRHLCLAAVVAATLMSAPGAAQTGMVIVSDVANTPGGQVFAFSGSGFRTGGQVTIHIVPSARYGSPSMGFPAPDGTLHFGWGGWSTGQLDVGNYETWVTDDATGLASNRVSFTVSMPLPPPDREAPRLSIDPLVGQSGTTVFTFNVTGLTPGGLYSGNLIYEGQYSGAVCNAAVPASGSVSFSQSFGGPEGGYSGPLEWWFVDCATGLSSNHVTLTIAAKTTLQSSNRGTASQTAVLQVRRDIRRRGGWGFLWRSPDPYGYGEAVLPLNLADAIPPGSVLTSAILTWNSSLTAATGATRPTPQTALGGIAAKPPRIYGSSSPCAYVCSPAAIQRWAPDATSWTDRLELSGSTTYALPASLRGPSGSLDLLSIYPATALMGQALRLVGGVRYAVGRPFFATEGWNAVTEFDVSGRAQLDLQGTVTIGYAPPPPTYVISGYVAEEGVRITVGDRSTTSDSNGRYLVRDLPSGVYAVSADKAGCTVLPSSRSVSLGPSATAVDFSTSCSSPSWQISDTGLPTGVRVNSVWARNSNDAYVWGSRTVPGGTQPESFLYRWDGTTWTSVFYLGNVWAGSVFGTGTSDVWFSAHYAPSGPSVIFRSTDNGVSWAQEALPAEALTEWIGSLSGTSDNIHAAAGSNRILHFDGNAWSVLSAGGITNNDAPGPITILSRTEGYYATCWGWGSWDGTAWTYHPNGFDFCDVGHIWAMRDTNGLSLFTAGNNNFSNGVRVWQLQGSSFGGKCGFVFGDPINGTYNCNGVFAGNGSYGYATGVWGAAADDIWVTGKLGYPTGLGRIYHYDGQVWSDVTGAVSATIGETLPITTALFGTASDDLWVALADGRVLRYQR